MSDRKPGGPARLRLDIRKIPPRTCAGCGSLDVQYRLNYWDHANPVTRDFGHKGPQPIYPNSWFESCPNCIRRLTDRLLASEGLPASPPTDPTPQEESPQ